MASASNWSKLSRLQIPGHAHYVDAPVSSPQQQGIQDSATLIVHEVVVPMPLYHHGNHHRNHAMPVFLFYPEDMFHHRP